MCYGKIFKKTTLPTSAERYIALIVCYWVQASEHTVLMLCQMHSCSDNAFVICIIYTMPHSNVKN